MSEPTHVSGSAGSRQRLSTAGKLLDAIAKQGEPKLEEIARYLRIKVRRLEECRDGICPLEPEMQMRLAATVVALGSEHKRLAYALYAQAQAALRMQQEPDRSHKYYPRERFR